MAEPTIFEFESDKEHAIFSDEELTNYNCTQDIPENFLRKEVPHLPQLSEIDVVRHFTRLSQLNYGVDSGFYPLGSCTMKYNPKINEKLARLPQFSELHPYQDESLTQGILQIFHEMQHYLSEICGMAQFSLQPSAGAHGELTGLLIMRKFHQTQGNNRSRILVPDSSHGTNPASAYLAGFSICTIPSNEKGEVDLAVLEKELDETVAGVMLTNPNTLGLFESNILQIAQLAHKHGALLYYDGANLNALLGTAKPGDMGFDIIHVNLHKTFSTPHGGGGPGSGPVGVSDRLKDFLPCPLVTKKEELFVLDFSIPHSIGRVRSFYGNTAVILKAYCYIRALGKEGLSKTGKSAVINANYLMKKLKDLYLLPYDRTCMHEFVLSANVQSENDVHALDIAKRLLDLGYHAPTIYFPLIVSEAMMIEPTETETKKTLDEFCVVMEQIAQEAQDNPEILKEAPKKTPVSRLDEVKAAKDLKLTWK